MGTRSRRLVTAEAALSQGKRHGSGPERAAVWLADGASNPGMTGQFAGIAAKVETATILVSRTLLGVPEREVLLSRLSSA